MKQVQLSIPEPCHQDWNEMTPTQQGRHCSACAKQVIDFTAMNDTEVLNYFSNIKNEKVCGRAYPDQLERAITKPKEIKRKPFWHWNYITMLFLFFSKNSAAKIHGGILLKTTKTDPYKVLLQNLPFKSSIASLIIEEPIRGVIRDIDGNPVAFACIKLKGADKGIFADNNGHYSIKINTKYDVLEISGVGYETKEVAIAGLHHFDFTLNKAKMGGLVVRKPYLIEGEIKDGDENPIAFPVLKIKGNESVINGDANGYYVIKADKNDILKVSATGYKEKEIIINDNGYKNISLDKSENLEEVVVGGMIGYSEDYVAPDEPKHVAVLSIKDNVTMQPLNNAALDIKKLGSYKIENANADKKGIYKLKKIREYETYTIVASAEGYESKEITIKGFDFDERKLSKEILLTKKPIEKIEQSAKIIIGGVRSVVNNKEPLVVIDNIISSNQFLEKIDPNNIENIKVLKDAEATAIYGSDASAGVIIITTKKELAKPAYKLLDTVAVKSELQTKRKTLTGACTQISGEMLSTVTVTRTYTDIINTISTKISGTLKIAPNPVQKGNPINLSFKLKENGAYTIQVITAAGTMLLQKQVFASSKNYTEQMPTNRAWSSGVYYIRLLDINNKLISTNSFVIQ